MRGLPGDIYEKEEMKVFIKSVFKRHTKIIDNDIVSEISFAKDFKNTLFMHRSEAHLVEKISIENEKMLIKKDFSSKKLKNL